MPTEQPSARSHSLNAVASTLGLRLRLRDGAPLMLRVLALAPRGERVVIVAEDATGEAIGRAEYVRVYGPRAVLTLKVDEPFWCLRLPEALLSNLCRVAADHGISTLLARVREPDARLLALLLEQFDAREAPAGDSLDLEIATEWPSAAQRTTRA